MEGAEARARFSILLSTPPNTFNRMFRVFLARTDPSSREAKPTCWKKVMMLCGEERRGRRGQGLRDERGG